MRTYGRGKDDDAKAAEGKNGGEEEPSKVRVHEEEKPKETGEDMVQDASQEDNLEDHQSVETEEDKELTKKEFKRIVKPAMDEELWNAVEEFEGDFTEILSQARIVKNCKEAAKRALGKKRFDKNLFMQLTLKRLKAAQKNYERMQEDQQYSSDSDSWDEDSDKGSASEVEEDPKESPKRRRKDTAPEKGSADPGDSDSDDVSDSAKRHRTNSSSEAESEDPADSDQDSDDSVGEKKRRKKTSLRRLKKAAKKANPESSPESESESEQNDYLGHRLLRGICSSRKIRKCARRLGLTTVRVEQINEQSFEMALYTLNTLMQKIQERTEGGERENEQITSVLSAKLFNLVPIDSCVVNNVEQVAELTERILRLRELGEADAIQARFGNDSESLVAFMYSQYGLTEEFHEKLWPGIADVEVESFMSLSTANGEALSRHLVPRFQSWQGVGSEQTLYVARPASSIPHILRNGLEPYPFQAPLLSCGRGLVFFRDAKEALGYYSRRSKVSTSDQMCLLSCRVALGRCMRTRQVEYIFPRAPTGYHSIEVFGETETQRYIVFDRSQVLPLAIASVKQ